MASVFDSQRFRGQGKSEYELEIEALREIGQLQLQIDRVRDPIKWSYRRTAQPQIKEELGNLKLRNLFRVLKATPNFNASNVATYLAAMLAIEDIVVSTVRVPQSAINNLRKAAENIRYLIPNIMTYTEEIINVLPLNDIHALMQKEDKFLTAYGPQLLTLIPDSAVHSQKLINAVANTNTLLQSIQKGLSQQDQRFLDIVNTVLQQIAASLQNFNPNINVNLDPLLKQLTYITGKLPENLRLAIGPIVEEIKSIGEQVRESNQALLLEYRQSSGQSRQPPRQSDIGQVPIEEKEAFLEGGVELSPEEEEELERGIEEEMNKPDPEDDEEDQQLPRGLELEDLPSPPPRGSLIGEDIPEPPLLRGSVLSEVESAKDPSDLFKMFKYILSTRNPRKTTTAQLREDERLSKEDFPVYTLGQGKRALMILGDDLDDGFIRIQADPDTGRPEMEIPFTIGLMHLLARDESDLLNLDDITTEQERQRYLQLINLSGARETKRVEQVKNWLPGDQKRGGRAQIYQEEPEYESEVEEEEKSEYDDEGIGESSKSNVEQEEEQPLISRRRPVPRQPLNLSQPRRPPREQTPPVAEAPPAIIPVEQEEEVRNTGSSASSASAPVAPYIPNYKNVLKELPKGNKPTNALAVPAGPSKNPLSVFKIGDTKDKTRYINPADLQRGELILHHKKDFSGNADEIGRMSEGLEKLLFKVADFNYANETTPTDRALYLQTMAIVKGGSITGRMKKIQDLAAKDAEQQLSRSRQSVGSSGVSFEGDMYRSILKAQKKNGNTSKRLVKQVRFLDAIKDTIRDSPDVRSTVFKMARLGIPLYTIDEEDLPTPELKKILNSSSDSNVKQLIKDELRRRSKY